MARKLWKTTVTIRSPFDPEAAEMELSALARDAETGESVCTEMRTKCRDAKECTHPMLSQGDAPGIEGEENCTAQPAEPAVAGCLTRGSDPR